MKQVRTWAVISSVIALLFVTTAAFAQITSGSVTGTIKDSQGGVIPGATVVMTSETKGTKSTPVVSNTTGDFSFLNVSPDTYTVEVTMSGFKTTKRSGVSVGSGDRIGLGVITIEVGGLEQTVEVKADAPLIQAQSGERSFTIPTDAVANLPIANRSFTALTSLTPGVSGNSRIGGGGGNNIMIDGVSAVDTGSNAILLQMNVESIAEVKVLTSGYQAEYGRSSGLQVTAVTKSGTNRFHGSLYDVERNSSWNSNSKSNILQGLSLATDKQRDWGYSIGGPIGKPGGNNKLFFFYSHEFAPRSQGGTDTRFRVPTALERSGNFSQTYDNNGALFTNIIDPQTGKAFAGSIIPANRIYGIGQTVLNQYPLPNINGAGLNYNYEYSTLNETATGNQPAVRVDYQRSSALRFTAKYSGWGQTNGTYLGSMSAAATGVGITESKQYRPIVFTDAFTVNYTLTPTTFLEATYGHSQNDLAGCALAQGGTGPTFCTSAVPEGAISNKNAAGLGQIPMIFPNALVLNTNYYAYTVMQAMNPPMWQDGQVEKTPNFSWGNRISNAPPNSPFAGYLNSNKTNDISVSLTKVHGSHTFKGGFYNTHSWKAQQQNSGATFGTYNFGNSTGNPLDSGFGYANALLGVMTSFNQLSTYIEGSYVYNNTEFYLQDNWKTSSRLTLDYGVRFVHQQPQYDSLGQASNFLPASFDASQVPVLYVPACNNNTATCTGTNREAKNPATGQLLGLGTSGTVGTLVPGTGNSTNGVFLSGHGIASTTYTWPTMGYAPRFGAAYDLKGDQKMVVRGGMGLYFDRPSGNSIYAQVTNPPSVINATINNGFLQSVGAAGTQATVAAPALSVFQYDGGLPSSLQWNTGLQMSLPWQSALDVSYVGQHAWNQYSSINLNAVDPGTAYLPQYQDSTQAKTFLGSNIVPNDAMRFYQGYAAISQQNSWGWSTYHSLQLSYQRRFTNGVSFGFNDTWSLQQKAQSAARIVHANGTWAFSPDQDQADALLNANPVAHNFKANFVWDLPDIKSTSGAMHAIGYVVNDWQLSGIWTASTSAPYTVGYNYKNGGASANITGSPDYSGRVYVVGAPGSGCSSNLLQQFNTGAFAGPQPGSNGLESGANYMGGCFQSALDLTIQRNIKLGGGKTVQLRLDMFNAPNQAIVTTRNTTMNLDSPATATTVTNLPYDANGNVIPTLALPNSQAGFGVATAFQSPRSLQAQIRFGF